MNRLVIVPDEQLEPLARTLKSQLSGLVDELRSEHLAGLLSESCRRILLSVARNRRAQEVLLWGLSDAMFRVAWTSLPPESEVLNIVTAARNEGLPAQVRASGLSAMQTADELQAGAWTNLEERRGQVLESLAASPVFLFDKCAAALSLAKYRTDESPVMPSQTDLAEVAEKASLLGRLLEDRLIRACLGMESL